MEDCITKESEVETEVRLLTQLGANDDAHGELLRLRLLTEEHFEEVHGFLKLLDQTKFLSAYNLSGAVGVLIGLHVESCISCGGRMVLYGIKKAGHARC